MRIENLRLEEGRGLATATVTWEDCNRAPQEIFFATAPGYASYISCNTDAYLVASILPAMYYGEKRIKIDGQICPELREGIGLAISWFRNWYGLSQKTPEIEAKVPSTLAGHNNRRDAGSFLSGGIDSLSLLRTNRLMYPEAHPMYIKKCFFVYGFDIGSNPANYDEQKKAFEQALGTLSEVTDEAKVTLIPVYTNIRHLNHDVSFWMYQFNGAALAAVAHSFNRVVHTMSVASGGGISALIPWGSHPLIDPNYSSTDLKIRHDGLTYSRLAKTKIVAEWETALQNIRVCTHIWSAQKVGGRVLNCGKCEKCVRTMAALLALGMLKKSGAFPYNDLSIELVSNVTPTDDEGSSYWRELIVPLQLQGRDDLAKSIRKILYIHRIKRKIKSIDNRVLGARLSRFKKAFFKK